MKKLALSLLLICLRTAPDYAQHQGWYWQNPTWGGIGANDVCFVDEHTGWIVGYLGTVMKTTDGGIHFNSQDLHTDDTFLGLCFPSPEVGYIFGGGGSLYKTTNAGSEWVKKPNSIGQYLSNSYFFNENNGWLCGYNGTLVKTTDGGTSWQRYPTGTTNNLLSVHFLDEDNGITGGWSNTLLKTTDGGLSWESIAPAGSHIFKSVFYVTVDTIYAGGVGGLLRSADGGLTWKTVLTSEIVSLKFFQGATTGIAAGYGVFKTTDGGDNWATLWQYNWTYGSINRASILNDNYIFITGAMAYYGTTFLSTTNAGQSWNNYSSSLLFNGTATCIYFLNPEKGFVSGDFYNDGLYMTTDGGSSWSFSPIGMNTHINDIKFYDDNTGIAVGSGFSIARSTNGGSSWENIHFAGGNKNLSELSLPEYPYGYAFGKDAILKTVDGGMNWEPLGVPALSYGTGYFISRDTGWTAGNGFIKGTTNGGQTWVDLYSGGGSFYSIWFATADSGWACGTGDNVGRTTDGGLTWNAVSTGASGNQVFLSKLFFLSSREGYVSGKYGFLGYTNDGGVTWHKQNPHVGQVITSVFFTNSQTGWITGYNGFIMKTGDGGITASSSGEIPQEINQGSVFQLRNYPNPFRSQTSINWLQDTGGKVKLTVYDLTGREIRTLADKNYPSGKHQVIFNAYGLPEGIYICCLQLNTRLETRQILISHGF